MREPKESFIIYTGFYKPVSMLSDKQLGRLFRALFRYNLGEEFDVEEDIRMAYAFFTNQMEVDERKRQAKIMRDVENGRKGGNPKLTGKAAQPTVKGGLTPDNPPLRGDKAINENENENENVSLFPRARAQTEEGGDAAERERELFFEEILFFEKKIAWPMPEAERFRNHYARTGWLDANGTPIRDKRAALLNWDTRGAPLVDAAPEDLQKFRRLYDGLTNDKAKRAFLDGVYRITLDGVSAKVRVHVRTKTHMLAIMKGYTDEIKLAWFAREYPDYEGMYFFINS